MITVLLGPPGVGKGTQAQAAAASQGWMHMSTGEMLRDEVGRGTELGLQADQFMRRGDLVPDDVMVDMVAVRVSQVPSKEVLLLDGFPRTLPQSEALVAKAPSGAIGLSVYFRAPDEVLVQRLLSRGRRDDAREVVRHRLAVYHETTEPLVGFYREQGILREIDADRSIEIIQEDLVRTVQAALEANFLP
ncbi:MAG: adenylate kinase [Planctomycetes bacterium]|nr:adenylate kinase [Planctomycetota bacterium]MBL7007739.1 adenylate kinase [Planctomycetota bacterium]